MNKKIYKVTQTQLSSLQSNGFITVDGVRYDYDPNSLYILADPFAPEYRLETQGHNLHLLKDNVIISDLTVPFAQASVYASNAKNLQNKTGSKAYTYYDILPRVDYKDFLSINDLPMEGILCGISRNGYFYKVREEGTNTDIPFTLFCQTVDGYYSLSTSEITTPIEVYTIHDYFNEAKFTPYGTVTSVNGTSPDSNGNVQLNIPTVNNGLLTIQRNGANVATFHANQSGDTLANISVPTELAQLGGRTFSNITSRGEEYLEWGGPAKVGDVSPIGTAMSSEHNANRIAFINPDALKVEYSSDGGSTWTDYPITGDGTEQKTRLCTKNADYRIGRPDNSTNLIANKSKTRITITGTDGKKKYVYSALKKMLINVSTATALSLLVERRTGANYESNGAWETVSTYKLAGWSGWNDIPLNFVLGGGLDQKSNYWQMRLTITCVTVNTNYPKEAAVLGLRLFGTTSWFPPSTLAETGHLYRFDMYQNAIFPAAVSATTFMENNKVLSDKYLGKTAQAADSAKLNGQPSSHYLTSIKMNGTTKTSTNSTIDLGTVITDITDLVPYTGATKDVNLGNHSFTMSSVFTVGSESSVYTQATPGSISLKNPIGTLSIGISSLTVNGTSIYWPTVSADPNGKYFALKSDIPANIKDGTGNGSLACGAETQAIGEYSFAQGYKTKASSPRQAVFGTLNSDDGNALLIVGNGDENGRKNVFTVNKDGTTTIAKDPVNDFDVATKGYVDRGYVKKLGSTGEYKVYMSSPAGNDTSRTIATAPIGSSVPIRTQEGHILLPDASVSMPAPNEAISAGIADDLYGLDRKTKDFHPNTTLRWLNVGGQREMVINGSWIGFYKDGKQTTLLYPDKFTYLNKNVKWNDLADLVENGTVLLNGDTGSIGSYTSVGNGVSSALNFAGQNISNTAKGVNSLSLGRLNSVEGAACFAYGNKNIIKGVASIAFGGGNTAGEKIDWTSLDAATNSSSSYCFAIGENNTSIGRTSITIGTANNSKGDGSISIGRDNTIWSKESVAIGRNNYLNRVSTGSYEETEPDQGNGIVAIGTGLKTPLRYRDADYSNNFYWNCVISGRYNDPYAYNCVRSSDLVYASNLPPLFTLGNGLSDTSRNNAIVLFHNASTINSDFIYFNEYSIFNKKCEFRGSETIIEGTLKDASGAQYIKGGTITTSFINSLF